MPPCPPLKIHGLVAATYTPLKANGELQLAEIKRLTDDLVEQGLDGLYVCGSTGEGMSLSGDERKQVAAAYCQAAAGRLPVIVQVGHNSLFEAKQLATHAGDCGASAISATCPSYFKVHQVDTLVDCMAQVAAGAPDLPFYYYHIPALTGSELDVVEFLKRAGDRIPNLAGIKYTEPKLHVFQQCLELAPERFDVFWGCDEMLLGALATGATAAIGSTYNIAAPIYRQVIDAFQQGDVDSARRHQARAVELIDRIYQFPFHSAMKAILEFRGFEMGPCRLPQLALEEEEREQLRASLSEIGFLEGS